MWRPQTLPSISGGFLRESVLHGLASSGIQCKTVAPRALTGSPGSSGRSGSGSGSGGCSGTSGTCRGCSSEAMTASEAGWRLRCYYRSVANFTYQRAGAVKTSSFAPDQPGPAEIGRRESAKREG